MISKSEKHNPEYLAKVVSLDPFKPLKDSDNLKFATVDMVDVIIGNDAKEGDLYIYFPVESCIDSDFLSRTNSFSSSIMNEDETQKGFFGKNGRVKAVRLRGELSIGYLVPVETLNNLYGINIDSNHVGEYFDTINPKKGDSLLLVKKYEIPKKEFINHSKEGKKPRISRLVEGQARLHIDTPNLRREFMELDPNDLISITYKTHGTSFWCGKLLTKKKLSLWNKIGKVLGMSISDKEYSSVYGSRRVVKNEYETQGRQDYYGEDVWGVVAKSLYDVTPAGYTIYGECLGYTPGGQAIQKGYDYGCANNQHKIQVYRVTFTNTEGVVVDLTHKQVIAFCKKRSLPCVHEFYYGRAFDLYPKLKNWSDEFIKELENEFNGKDCFLCNNKVPEEGIVLRIDNSEGFKVFKLKSMRFLEYETKQLDQETK